MVSLNGRVEKLERRAGPARGSDDCRRCGLRHAVAMTMTLVRGIWGPGNWRTPEQVAAWRARYPFPAPLCLCDECCGDVRGLAELTHRPVASNE